MRHTRAERTAARPSRQRGVHKTRTYVLFSQPASERNKTAAVVVSWTMSTLVAGTRFLLPRLLLVLFVGVLVLVVLPAVLAAAGGMAA